MMVIGLVECPSCHTKVIPMSPDNRCPSCQELIPSTGIDVTSNHSPGKGSYCPEPSHFPTSNDEEIPESELITRRSPDSQTRLRSVIGIASILTGGAFFYLFLVKGSAAILAKKIPAEVDLVFLVIGIASIWWGTGRLKSWPRPLGVILSIYGACAPILIGDVLSGYGVSPETISIQFRTIASGDSSEFALPPMKIKGTATDVRLNNAVLLDQTSIERGLLEWDKNSQNYISFILSFSGTKTFLEYMGYLPPHPFRIGLGAVIDGDLISVFWFNEKILSQKLHGFRTRIYLPEEEARNIVRKINRLTNGERAGVVTGNIIAALILLSLGGILIVSKKAFDQLLQGTVSIIVSLVGGINVYVLLIMAARLLAGPPLALHERLHAPFLGAHLAFVAVIGVALIWWGAVLWRRALITVGTKWIILGGFLLLSLPVVPSNLSDVFTVLARVGQVFVGGLLIVTGGGILLLYKRASKRANARKGKR